MSDRKRSGGIDLRADKVKTRDVVGRDLETKVTIMGDEAIRALRELAARGSQIGAADDTQTLRPAPYGQQPTRASGTPRISLDYLRALEQQLESYVDGYLESLDPLTRCKAIKATILRDEDEAVKEYNKSWWIGLQENLDQIHLLSTPLVQLLEIAEIGDLIKSFDSGYESANSQVENVMATKGEAGLEALLKDLNDTIGSMVGAVSKIMETCKKATKTKLQEINGEIQRIFGIVNPDQAAGDANVTLTRQTAARPPNPTADQSTQGRF